MFGQAAKHYSAFVVPGRATPHNKNGSVIVYDLMANAQTFDWFKRWKKYAFGYYRVRMNWEV